MPNNYNQPMKKPGNKIFRFVGFITFFTLAVSGFEYFETGQLSWYKTPLNTARDLYSDLSHALSVTPVNAAEDVELTGRVSRITDGDTLSIISPNNETRIIRLYGIDAPERDQPYGLRATDALKDKLSSKQVTVILQDIDDYGRYVGIVYLNDRNINLEMVIEGHAWWYEFFASDNQELKQAQSEARERNLGLWNNPDPQEPYEWRRSH
jgi:endonuclease YncB( thermonuclease family)